MIRSKMSLSVDLNDYGIDPVVRPKYLYRAICTSDACRLAPEDVAPRTEAGVIKDVPITKDYCPECKNALFWEKYRK